MPFSGGNFIVKELLLYKFIPAFSAFIRYFISLYDKVTRKVSFFFKILFFSAFFLKLVIFDNSSEENMELFVLGFLAFLGIALLVIAAKTIKIVPQSSVLLIERLGKFHRVAASGLNIIVPFIETPRGVYWTNVRPANFD